MSTRRAAVAGQFYPGGEKALLAELERCLPAGLERGKAIGVVVPHAGYVYSGACAGAVYARVVVPDRVAVFSPNHTGAGEPVSVWSEGGWATPLGEVPVDEELAAAFLEKCPAARSDRAAHLREHSLEVQLPFLRKINPDVKILPVTLGTHSVETLKSAGEALAAAIGVVGGDVLIVASSDMTHIHKMEAGNEGPVEAARRQDEMAIEKVKALDPAGLLDVVAREGITMCGVGPVSVMLWAALELGAKQCELVEYTNSSAASGDDSYVVGYAGLIVT
jgi:AmmeMemoRadiSam system protein B